METRLGANAGVQVGALERPGTRWGPRMVASDLWIWQAKAQAESRLWHFRAQGIRTLHHEICQHVGIVGGTVLGDRPNHTPA